VVAAGQVARAAQVLEQPQAVAGHGEAAPAAVEHGPNQGGAAGLAGQSADDLNTAAGFIYQMIARRGRQRGMGVHPHRFRHHFGHISLDRGGPEGDLTELNGWTSPQMLCRYGASAHSARARRTYDRIMTNT